MNGTYQPSPVLRVEIPKKNGGKRPLGIPTVCDRLIQQSILHVLQPRFDPEFSESSFGFRPNRSAHGAVRRVQELIRNGYRFVVDIDIEKFFDRVNHDILTAHPIPDLDSWIRRRVRMCYIKAWRKRRTRIRNLQARGVLMHTAIRTGLIERGWWYLSGVLGEQNGIGFLGLK
jgi:RNA-directed DNA polymerase